MKHKTRTKALSWLLCLVLIAGLLPVMGITAQAANNYTSLEDTWSLWQRKKPIEKGRIIYNSEPFFVFDGIEVVSVNTKTNERYEWTSPATLFCLTSPANQGLVVGNSSDTDYGNQKSSYDVRKDDILLPGTIIYYPVTDGQGLRYVFSDNSLPEKKISGAAKFLLPYYYQVEDFKQYVLTLKRYYGATAINPTLAGVPTSTIDPELPITGMSVTGNTGGGAVGYYCSADNGSTWTPFQPSEGIPVSGTVQIKAKVAAIIKDGTPYAAGETPAVTVEVYPPHVHSFGYSVGTGDQANTITAVCQNPRCKLTEEIVPLTISAPSGVLAANGSSYPATLNSDYNTTAFPGTYTITYTKDGEPYAGTPTEAGEYTASVTAGEGDNAATASVSYTVLPMHQLTYDGNGGYLSENNDISENFNKSEWSPSERRYILPKGWTSTLNGTSPVWEVQSKDYVQAYNDGTLILPSCNLSVSQSASISFSYQTSKDYQDNMDAVSVKYSLDNGTTWIDTDFTNKQSDTKTQATVALPTGAQAENVQIAFINENRGILGTAIDNVVVTGPVTLITTVVDPNRYVHGDTATVSSTNPFTLGPVTGATFIGWNTEADGTGTSYAVGDTISINADTTLYAQWDHAHEFTYSVSDSGETITATCVNDDGICKLPNHTATLTLAAPTQETGGAAVATATPEGAFGTLPDVQYAVRQEGGTFGEGTTTPPTDKGFYKASITLVSGENTGTAYVVYGVNCIAKDASFDATQAHGDFDVPKFAAVGATIQATNITPDTGYELGTLTAEAGGQALTVTNNSFTMPDQDVTVNATFTPIDYTITLPTTQHGRVTAKSTANIGETVTLTVGLDNGYGLKSISVKDASQNELTLTQTSGNGETGEGTYSFVMPADNVTVSAEFEKLTVYTVFYRPSSDADHAVCRFEADATDGYRLEQNSQFGSISCWAGQFRAADGRTSFPIAFRDTDAGNWGTLSERPVVDYLAAALNAGEAVVVKGEQDVFLVSFLWGESGEVTEETAYTIPEDQIACYFVTSNAPSLTLPASPTLEDGYRFNGWEYSSSPSQGGPELKTTGANDTTLTLTNNITRSTIITPMWQKIEPKLTFDLNGGSWGLGDTPVNVPYGTTAAAPAEVPTRADLYVFDRWVVEVPEGEAGVTERLIDHAQNPEGTRDVLLTDGTLFDFDNTKFIESITLRAEWKHVHAYARMQINDPALGGQYGQYSAQAASMHLKICADLDDYALEAHTYDSKGLCSCGYQKPVKMYTLSLDYKGEGKFYMMKKAENTAVSVTAAAFANKEMSEFLYWNYRYSDQDQWMFLSQDRCVTFTVDSDMQVKAVYENLDKKGQYARLTTRRYGTDGVLFQLNYLLPENWTVVDAGVMGGYNSMVRYFRIVDEMWGNVQCALWDNNAIDDLGAGTVLERMYSGVAMNVNGYSREGWAHAKVLGTSGRAILVHNKISSANGDRIYYGIGYVQCKDPNGRLHHYVVGPMTATYNDPEHTELGEWFN